MKITPVDLTLLEHAMVDTLKAHNLHPYMAKTLSHMWDIFHKAWNEKRLDGDALYKHYTDANLETAFKRILKSWH